MRDFPIFPTEHGAASLTLRHIPYSGCAYIRIQSAADPEALLRDCADFCRQAGAERIFAAGHEALDAFPLHTAVLEMRGEAFVDEEKRKCLFPVTEATVKRWREYYNRRMAGVDNAAFLEARDEEKITDSCWASAGWTTASFWRWPQSRDGEKLLCTPSCPWWRETK